MEKLIEFKNLRISLGDRILYDGLNLCVNKTDRFIFLGPNGAGKSLLLELISLGYCNELAQRYEGLKVSGTINDADGNNLLDPSVERTIAYAQQEEDFYKGDTVIQGASTACAGVGIELDEDRLDYLLDKFSLKNAKKKKIEKSFSYGERKIIHLIFTILKLRATDILLLDEPLNHLSFKNSQVFNEVINEEISRNPNLAVIMVSHCRAMDFTRKAMIYDVSTKSIKTSPYESYNCFRDEIGVELGCNTCT